MQPPSPHESHASDLERGGSTTEIRTAEVTSRTMGTVELRKSRVTSVDAMSARPDLSFKSKSLGGRIGTYFRKLGGLKGNLLLEHTWRRCMISAFGSFISVVAVASIHYFWLRYEGYIFLLGSVAATAVVICFWPDAPSSQPLAAIVGHSISAVVGMVLFRTAQHAAYAYIRTLFAALSVTISTVVMFAVRCFHPPATSTALIAFIGSRELDNLGYLFVAVPTASSVALVVLISALYLNLFEDIVYPRYWMG